MEDYFEKQIAQYTARISQALDSIPKDLSDEQAVLATKCNDRLNEAQNKLELLAADWSARQQQNKDARLREFQRVVRDVEYVETVGIAALERSNEVDEKLNCLVKKIRREINYPLPLPPAVTAISKDYFYVHTRFNFNLICVPPGERNSLLHLPDLYHELAHPLLTEKNLPKIQPFQEGLKKIRDIVLGHFTSEIMHRSRQRGPDTSGLAEVWLQNWYQSWATEFLCDLFAVYTLGPAFVWSHYSLCAKKTENPFEVGTNTSSTHPADDARMTLMLFALDRLGFTETADKIENRWNELIESSASKKELEYPQCYPRKILGEVEEIAYQAVVKMKSRIVSHDTKDYVHTALNQAWEKFWENRESFVDWELEEVGRLYDYCMNTSKTKSSLKTQNNAVSETTDFNSQTGKYMASENTNSLADTERTFQTALSELQHSLASTRELLKEYPFLQSEDVQKLRVEFIEPSRGGIYDHVTFERKFLLSNELVRCFDAYWKLNKTSEDQKKRMCKLFFLHEFLHTPQHVDSNTYPYSKNSKTSFRYIDYDADAFAVKGCFKTESSYLPWNQHLAEILIAHIKGGEVFAQADDGRASESMEGGRLHRQAIWCLQYARARAFRTESGFNEFYLDRHIIIEIFRILPNGDRENLCLKDAVSNSDFNGVVELHISWAGYRIRYSLTARHFIDSLVKGVFQCDFDSISEAFRPLFDTNPELIGRGNSSLVNNSANDMNEEFDRLEFIQKLRSLHGDDLGQIIISIPNASQKVSNNETNARKIEQLISWAESGSGPKIEKIYEVAKKLYPSHFS